MKKVKLVFCFVFLTWSCSNGQASRKYPCELLQKSVETKAFKEVFYLCKYPWEDIPIIDVRKKFQNCSLLQVCDRRIVVYDSSSVDRMKNIIFLFRIDRKKNIYTLYFVNPPHTLPDINYSNYPYMGNTVDLKFKVRKNQIEFISSESGAF